MTMLFKPILALNIINFSSCRNYLGGGGGKTICLPPRIDASVNKGLLLAEPRLLPAQLLNNIEHTLCTFHYTCFICQF